MVTTVDYNGNTIGDNHKLGKYNTDSDHASHLVCVVPSFIDIFSDFDCIGFSNFSDSPNDDSVDPGDVQF